MLKKCKPHGVYPSFSCTVCLEEKENKRLAKAIRIICPKKCKGDHSKTELEIIRLMTDILIKRKVNY